MLLKLSFPRLNAIAPLGSPLNFFRSMITPSLFVHSSFRKSTTSTTVPYFFAQSVAILYKSNFPAINLGKDSLFYGYKGEGKYYGADYDFKEVNSHHIKDRQEYLICGTPICADVFISLPKLKTHKKTGVTLSIKN